MAKVMNWYRQQPSADLNAVAPWTAIPNVLKQTSFWNAQEAADEQHIITLNPSFPSHDAFGIFVETGIHDRFLHSATAAAFNEPIIGTFHSPQSTFFYQIHGLVDHWWRQLQGFGNLADGRPFWIGNFAPQANRAQVLFYFPGDGNWWLGIHDGNRFNWSLASNTVGFGQVWDGRPFWIGNFSPQANRAQVLFYFPGDQNWWLGIHDGNRFNWSLAGNTAGFGQVADGRPFWIGDFNGDGRADVLFYFPGDQNWWLGVHDGNQLNWSLAGNTAGFGQVWDGRPFWIGNFWPQANRAQVLFYFPGDQNWWLGVHDGNQLNWSLAGNTAGFGQVADGRPFWTGNFAPQANRAQVLFYFPGDGNWWLGIHDGNRFNWSLASNTGLP
jgi:hypothetical protein